MSMMEIIYTIRVRKKVLKESEKAKRRFFRINTAVQVLCGNMQLLINFFID